MSVSEYRISIFCDMTNEEIRIQFDNTADGRMEKYGDILLLSLLIMRVFSISRDSEIKNSFADALRIGSGYAWTALEKSIKNNGFNVSWVDAELIFGEAGASKRGFALDMRFNSQGHVDRLKPRGFGIFGKYVDFASFFLLLGVYDFLLEKYPDESMRHKLSELVEETLDYIEYTGGKVSPQEAYVMSEELAKKQINTSH